MAGRATVVAVTRAGVPRLDVTELVGQEGDMLHVAVLKDAVEELEARIAGGTAEQGPIGIGERP